MILAVVVGDLIARLDVFDRLDADAAVANHRIGVGPARVIDVTRHVRAWRPVNGPARVHLEPVAIVGTRVTLRVGQQGARVFHDVGVLLDRPGREHAEPGTRTGNTEYAPPEHLRIVLATQFFGWHRAGSSLD